MCLRTCETHIQSQRSAFPSCNRGRTVTLFNKAWPLGLRRLICDHSSSRSRSVDVGVLFEAWVHMITVTARSYSCTWAVVRQIGEGAQRRTTRTC